MLTNTRLLDATAYSSRSPAAAFIQAAPLLAAMPRWYILLVYKHAPAPPAP